MFNWWQRNNNIWSDNYWKSLNKEIRIIENELREIWRDMLAFALSKKLTYIWEIKKETDEEIRIIIDEYYKSKEARIKELENMKAKILFDISFKWRVKKFINLLFYK